MPLTPEQITQLKVAKIKEELKKRGLDQSGTKALLIARLIANVEKEVEDEEEAPLTAPHKSEEETATAADPPAAAEKDSSIEEPIAEGAVPAGGGTEEDGEIKPKHTPIVYNIPSKDAAAMKADEEMKKKRRAERFGIVDAAEHEAKKLKARGERFNVTSSTAMAAENEAAKMEQRAKRFGQQSTMESGGKKDSKGHIDLSHIVSSTSVTDEEKKRRRAARFGASDK